MESLLRQLAGDHPPGPMPDVTSPEPDPRSPLSAVPPGKTEGEGGGGGDGGGEGKLSAEEEEKAWQQGIDMMLSGEGLEALGLDKHGSGSPTPAAPTAPRAGEKGRPDFQETIRRTMESLNQPAASGSGSRTVGDAAGPPNLAALLTQLGSDPSALDGLGGEGDELGGLLDGMMAQLMTREVLEEPMSELASKVCLVWLPSIQPVQIM